jgi:hypothetical protein
MTADKRAREQRLKDRRAQKEERKAARKLAASEGESAGPQEAGEEIERGASEA